MESLARLTHKTDAQSVWIAEIIEISPVGARFRYRIPDAEALGPTTAIEVARQAMHCFAHLQLDVVIDSKSLLTRATFAAADVAPFARAGELKLLCRAQGSGAAKKVAVAAVAEFLSGCDAIATCEIEGCYLSDELFERVERMSRAAAPSERPSFAKAARNLVAGRLLTAGAGARHTHVTGMQIIERALEQFRPDDPAAELERLEAAFIRVADDTAPLSFVGDTREGAVATTVLQRGVEIASLQLSYARSDRLQPHE